jgi:hypothetical protein
MNDRSSSRAKIKDIGPEKRHSIVKLRRERIAMRCIAAIVGVSVATVARVCAKAGLSRLSKIDPPPAVRRYERAKAGELLHIDIKKLGRIGCVGHRITGDPSVRARNVGWEFVHVAIDDFSRVSYVEILDNERELSMITTSSFSRVVRRARSFEQRADLLMADAAVAQPLDQARHRRLLALQGSVAWHPSPRGGAGFERQHRGQGLSRAGA